MVTTIETNAREGLHSLGERGKGPIPFTATIKSSLQCGVMASTRKTSFSIFVVSNF